MGDLGETRLHGRTENVGGKDFLFEILEDQYQLYSNKTKISNKTTILFHVIYTIK